MKTRKVSLEKSKNSRKIITQCNHHSYNNSKSNYCTLCRHINHFGEAITYSKPKSLKDSNVPKIKKRSSSSKENVKSRIYDYDLERIIQEKDSNKILLDKMKSKLDDQKNLIAHLLDKVEQNDEDIQNLKSQTNRMNRSNSFLNATNKSDLTEHEASQFIKNLKRKYGKENSKADNDSRKARDNRTISLNFHNPLDNFKTNKEIQIISQQSRQTLNADSIKNDSLIRMKQEMEMQLKIANKKIERLEFDLSQKDELLINQEKNFLGQINKLQERLEIAENENQNNRELQREVENYRKRLDLKQRELDITKASFEEKLEKEKKYHKQRKCDWKNIYGALLEDIGRLKQELADAID